MNFYLLLELMTKVDVLIKSKGGLTEDSDLWFLDIYIYI